jgi:hypothetical protein
LIDPTRWEEILALDLKPGGHDPDSAFCVMEAAAYVAGESWSDHPKCVDRVLSNLLISKNDSLASDAERNRLLRPLIPRIIGTRGSDELSDSRAWLVIDWSLCTALPMFLRALKLESEAEKFEALRELNSSSALALARAPALALALALARAPALALDLARALALALDRAPALAPALDRALALALDRALDRDLPTEEIADFQARYEAAWLELVERLLAEKEKVKA